MSKDKTAGEKFPFVFVKLCFSITAIFFAVNLKRSTSVPFLPQGKGGQQVGKILGVRRADAQRRATDRMANLDRLRVESLTRKRAHRWCEVPQRRATRSVYFISNQGVSDCSQVDAELVGPAGFRSSVLSNQGGTVMGRMPARNNNSSNDVRLRCLCLAGGQYLDGASVPTLPLPNGTRAR